MTEQILMICHMLYVRKLFGDTHVTGRRRGILTVEA